ncbi:TetR family transcriptional regulator [Streptomyces yunnanensis]|uniref:TetR family transcriptional regulator n=1 Tax=Streptomyces yunnanensis TaxID=156453 RepID=A0ABY8AMV2_9ACTN|nr:TetR/AcrR family transcriptional regulator [Streptomyces yunnanensis]WEB45486.1 TetR family transcriptional regulator [Streptomyces yunnanensis]
MRQERAARTRAALVRAAATEFVRHGYAGTSLKQVCEAAGGTMGALTFHFPAKRALADEVCGQAAVLTEAALLRVRTEAQSALQAVIDASHALAGLLTAQEVVLAAARLAREGTSPRRDWQALWTSVLRELLDRAWDEGMLAVEPAPAAGLVQCLMAGIEVHVQTAACPGRQQRQVGEQLAAAWALILPGLARAPHHTYLHPAGTSR